MERPKLLFTGFGTFGDHAVNPTEILIRALERRGCTVALLPVEYAGAAARAKDLVETLAPDAIVAFGLNAGTDRILIERLAINLDDAPLADNAGVRRAGQPIVPDGPVGYWTTLPVEPLIVRFGRAGLPAGVSNHAGSFVCNHLFYTLRHLLERRGSAVPAGFIHVPPLPGQVHGQAGRTGLAVDRLLAAADIVREVVADHLYDRQHLPAGTGDAGS